MKMVNVYVYEIDGLELDWKIFIVFVGVNDDCLVV